MSSLTQKMVSEFSNILLFGISNDKLAAFRCHITLSTPILKWTFLFTLKESRIYFKLVSVFSIIIIYDDRRMMSSFIISFIVLQQFSYTQQFTLINNDYTFGYSNLRLSAKRSYARAVAHCNGIRRGVFEDGRMLVISTYLSIFI